jgi:hypothetical protein
MLNNTTDLLQLRWRAAQWLLAVAYGDKPQVHALNEAMRIEGVATSDMLDELALLRSQFASRPAVYLRDEIARLWLRLKDRP